jgi:hypothetical protein
MLCKKMTVVTSKKGILWLKCPEKADYRGFFRHFPGHNRYFFAGREKASVYMKQNGNSHFSLI